MLRGRRFGCGMRGSGAGSELGQTIVTIALMGMFFVMLIALVWNVSSVWMTRRDLQNAADAAVLAGVQELDCTNNATPRANAKARAEEWAAKNEGDLDSNVATVDPSGLWVRSDVERDMPGFFGQFVGFEVSAKAKAAATCNPSGGIAIFAGSPVCKKETLKFQGQDSTFVGTVHSNGGLYGSGQDLDFNNPPVEYGQTCPSSEVDFPPAPTQGVAVQDYPIDRVPFDALVADSTSIQACDFWWVGDIDLKDTTTFNGQSIWTNTAKTALKPGRYCATGKIVFQQNSATGTGVQFVAGDKVEFAANFLSLHNDDVLAYGGGNGDAIVISGQAMQWSGALFGPDGLVKISGQGSTTPTTVTGSIIGNTIDISASNVTFIGTHGSSSVTKTYALTE